MSEIKTIQGKVVGSNSIEYDGRVIACWTNAMQAAIAPQPLNLSDYMNKVVKVRGSLHGDLWEAQFVKLVHEEGYYEITGRVIGFNVIEWPDAPIYCFRHGRTEAWFLPLNLTEYSGLAITVAGELYGHLLYRAAIVGVPEITIEEEESLEAASLHDLLKIRETNKQNIEKINGNLGTALGYKWTNGQKTDHPAIIIFVPQKVAPFLIPDEEKAPKILKGPNGKWCLTDVVSGGKAESLEEIGPLPDLSQENQLIVEALKSGRVGLIGGIQLAFFGDGIEDINHAFVGTAGIAVRHKETKKLGFLTNQHVADSLGRQMFHPWHYRFPIGRTFSTKEFAADENWYEGVIDEQLSYVRCDCGFVQIYDFLSGHVHPGLHIIGKTGPLLRIDINKMDIIGQRVISIGRTRGIQRGTIVAYSYEFRDDFFSVYTDLLIIGEDGRAFSWKGDSGKVIVTDDDVNSPVGLLWGGWQERLRHDREQEIWSYAIDLGKVLDRLDLELMDT